MLYNSETTNLGNIDDPIFIRDKAMGFDFSDRSEITFIIFYGLVGPDASSIAKSLGFWKKFFYSKMGHHVNVVGITDGGRDFGVYSANYLGIPGICSSTFELANLLNDKLYLRNGTTKRTVVFADCGGTIPAILTSSVVPYHSLNLTTPYLKVIGSEQEFDSSQYSVWIARKHAEWAHVELAHMKQWFNTVEYLDMYIRNPNSQLNMHWAKNIIGTDLLFRDSVRILENKTNVMITDHEIPPEIDGHMLQRHLITSRKYFTLVNNEIRSQFAALGIETKVTGL